MKTETETAAAPGPLPPAPAIGLALAARLTECAEWHKEEARRHKDKRLFMEGNNFGPPYPEQWEQKHLMFAKACMAAVAPNAKLPDQT